jgi:hypothetical protein
MTNHSDLRGILHVNYRAWRGLAVLVARVRLVLPALVALCVLFLSASGAAGDVIYDSIPSPLPPNVPSVGFQATQTAEFGDDVSFAGTLRHVTTAVVTMSAWAKHSDWPGYPAEGFSHPITLNLYNVDHSVPANPAVGTLITSVTQTFLIPWRPEADPSCGTAWLASDSQCYNGLAFNITFNLSALLPDEIIYGIAYNTNTWGYAPLHASGPYESLNVGLRDYTSFPGPLTVGTDVDSDALFWNTSTASHYTDGGAGGVGIFRRDTVWYPYTPAVQFAAICDADSDCGPNSFCDTAGTYVPAGTCDGQSSNGGGCDANNVCLSNICAGSPCSGPSCGTCCNTACTLSCQSCSTGTCTQTGGTCLIGGQCYNNGASNPLNPCQKCDSTANPTGWSNAANTTPCNDGKSCTTDQCDGAGTCVSTVNCPASDQCHIAGTCNSSGNCTNPTEPNGSACDDGNKCTFQDRCISGLCIGVTDSHGTFCDDHNPCTDDSCSPTSGCVHTPNTASCSDGNACTANDRCSGGQCVGGADVNCDDHNPCTADVCSASNGCAHTALPDGTQCSDATGNPATCGSGTCCSPALAGVAGVDAGLLNFVEGQCPSCPRNGTTHVKYVKCVKKTTLFMRRNRAITLKQQRLINKAAQQATVGQ